MTLAAADPTGIYQNQQQLRSTVANTAGVPVDKVLYYNQTARTDPRTSDETLSVSSQASALQASRVWGLTCTSTAV